MKRKSFLMLLTGMFAISSGALVGCNDDDDVNKKNSLSVTPASAIEFKAGDNQDVVLTVKTDAKSWAFEKNGEWIVAKQGGDKLTVNAQANTTESVRPGRITITAGNAEPVNINVNQKGLEVGEIVLSISPSDPIGFEYALDNIPRTQTIEPVYIETSAFFIFSRELWCGRGRRIGDRPYMAVVDRIEGLDIDYPEDFAMAEIIAASRNLPG